MPVTKSLIPIKPASRRAPVKAITATRKPPAKQVPAQAQPQAPSKPPAEKKATKQRVRLVRDSFTMPEPDFALIAALKSRAMAAQREAKKSELLRAGLHALMALDGATLVGALDRLQPLKAGRPKKGA